MPQASYLALVLDLIDAQQNQVTTGSVTLIPSVALTDAPDMMTIPPMPVTVDLQQTRVASRLLATDGTGPLPSGWAWNASFALAGAGIPSYSLFLPAGPASFTLAAGTPAVLTWTPPGDEPWQLQALPDGTGVQVSGVSGFVPDITYYVVNSSGDTVQLATSQGGPPVASALSGSGQLTVVQYNLSALAVAQDVTEMAAYMLLPSGTAAAGLLPFATGSGDGTTWRAIETSDLPAGGGSVTSFNGRSGAVTPASGDYTATEVGADPAGSAAAAQAASLQKSANLSDLANAATARTNLGLGSSATQPSSAFDAAGSATAAQAAAEAASDPAGSAATAQAASLQKSANLSDLANAGTARTNLGLGSAATQASSAFDTAGAAAAAQSAAEAASDPAGSAATAQAASLQKSANLSDLASAPTARTNLGLGSAATQNSSAFDAAGAASAAQAASLQKSSNLSDLASAATARTNLGLGSAATQNSSAFDTAGAAAAAQAAAEAASLPSTDDLSAIATANATAANVPMNGKKFTGMANGSAAGDSAAFGQIPVIDATVSDIQPVGSAAAAGSVGKVADAGHIHTGLSNVAATVVGGYTLVNGTGAIISWTAPNDGALHRCAVFSAMSVSSTESGGTIVVTGTNPDGTTFSHTLFGGGAAAGDVQQSNAFLRVVKAGTTVTVTQSAALTGGAAKLWAEIWAL